MASFPNTDRSAASSWSLLRVLCLHDERSNSLELSSKLDALGEKLYRNHGIDLVFVDAPLIVDDNTEPSDGNSDDRKPPRMLGGIHRHTPRAWWEEEKESPEWMKAMEREEEEKHSTEDVAVDKWDENNEPVPNVKSSASSDDPDRPPHYVGLDASLLLLKQVWNSSPFWGILAVGQAAGVAALLPLLPNPTGKEGQPPAFVIFVNGRTLLGEEESLTEHMHLPCLHIVDNPGITEREPQPVTPVSNPTQRLVRQFGGTVVYDNSLSRSSETTSAAFNNHVGRFLVARKRHLRKSVGDVAVLALRHELHRTEADAAQLVARQIAENPPEALMAVITPKDVGGFRDRRRGPGEEGGGAPCPSEFLLHRAKRSSKTKEQGEASSEVLEATGEEASRHHPNQTNQPKEQPPR